MDSVVFHPGARDEYCAAYQWYAVIGTEVARAFEEEVERALGLIREAPNRWPRFGTRHRRLVLWRFPYSLVYIPKATCIWIAAVAHASRRPGYWRSRRPTGR